jgi:outer membrane protein assembly factor BamB
VGLANSAKPDWRGDYANTGRLSATGPATQPSPVFSVTVPGGDPTSGIELDSNNNVIVDELNGEVVSYNPSGTLNWSATIPGPTGTDFACPSAQPVVSANGSLYMTDDVGNLWQINPAGVDKTGIVTPTVVFQDPNGAGFLGTPKLGPDNSLYVEDAAGSLFAVGLNGTENYEFDATGSLQVAGTYKGVKGTSPFKSCGEPALNPSSGVAYYTSMDTNTHFGKSLTLGSLYAVNPSGNLLWSKAMPLLAQSSSAVLYVAPGNGGGTDGTVIVTDDRPEIAAFDALTGTQLWSVAPPDPAPLVASPALSLDGTTVYVANTGGELYAYNVATGTLNTAFGTNGAVTVSVGKGTVSAPVVDAAGRIYVVGNDGTLYGFDASGTQLWTVAGGVDTGETGMIAPKAMTAAIDANGTLYVTGTSGNVRGFAVVGPPATATPTPTETVTPTPTITDTPSLTDTPSSTPTALGATDAETATAAAQQTGTANANASSTAAAQQTATANANASSTAAAQQTGSVTAQTATAVAQQTGTANAIASNTAAAQQTGTANAIASNTAAAQQTSSATALTATAVAQQTGTANAIASNTAAAQQSVSATALTATAIAQQTGSATAQTATAIAQQTGSATAQTATAIAQQTGSATALTATAVADQTATAQTATAVAQQTGSATAQTATAVAQQTATATAQTATAVAQQTGSATAQTATAVAQQTATAAARQTSTATATAQATNGPAAGWSMLGGSTFHDNSVSISLNLSHAPGTSWHSNIAPSSGKQQLRASAAIGPDGTVYQPDGNGALVAVDPTSGSIKWRSADVLGLLQPVTSFPVLDTGSSPAIAANGTIYAGSETGGIFSFSPTDGSNHEISTDGTYQNSSIIIGPDGTLYGGSVDGTVYALSPTGKAHWAAGDGYQITNCPPATTLFIISTPALDQNGNLYVGYSCKSASAFYKGGVISLNPDGTFRWNQSNTNASGSAVRFGAVFGPSVLSPDGSALYVVDTSGAGGSQLVALNTSNGQVKWSFAAGGNIEAPPVLSGDGQHIYLTATGVQSAPTSSQAYADSPVIEFNPDGSVANALHLGQDPTLDTSYTTVRPVVDKDGNLLLVTAHNLLGYSGDLSHTLFPRFNLGVTQASTFLGGLSVDSKGNIYVSDNGSNLLALSSAVNQPTATAVNTEPPPPTQITPPTFTPVPFIPTDTPTASDTPGGKTTSQATSTPSGNTTTSPAPGVVGFGSVPQAATTNTTSSIGKGITVQVASGTLGLANYSRVTVHVPAAGETVKYTLQVTTPLAAKGAQSKLVPIKNGVGVPKGCAVATTVHGAGTFHFTRQAAANKSDTFCIAISTALSANVASVKLALGIAASASDGTVSSGKVQFAMSRQQMLALQVSLHAAQVVTNGTQILRVLVAPKAKLAYAVFYAGAKRSAATYKGVANSAGLATLTFAVKYLPSPAAGTAAVAVDVAATQGTRIGTAVARFTVRRPDAVLVLQKVVVKLKSATVHPGGTLEVDTVSAQAAKLTYRVTYGGKAGPSHAMTANGSGDATWRFAVAFKPGSGKHVIATVSVVAQQGKKRVSGSARFTVMG